MSISNWQTSLKPLNSESWSSWSALAFGSIAFFRTISTTVRANQSYFRIVPKPDHCLCVSSTKYCTEYLNEYNSSVSKWSGCRRTARTSRAAKRKPAPAAGTWAAWRRSWARVEVLTTGTRAPPVWNIYIIIWCRHALVNYFNGHIKRTIHEKILQ